MDGITTRMYSNGSRDSASSDMAGPTELLLVCPWWPNWLQRVQVSVALLCAAAIWSYLAVRRAQPGRARLLLALPVLVIQFATPMLFDHVTEPLSRMGVSFFAFRMASSKVLAFCMGRGPLCQRHLNLLQFLAILLMPIVPKGQQQASQTPASHTSSSSSAQQQPHGNPSLGQPDQPAPVNQRTASTPAAAAAAGASSSKGSTAGAGHPVARASVPKAHSNLTPAASSSTGSSSGSIKPPALQRSRRSPRCSASSVHEQPGRSRAEQQQRTQSLPSALQDADLLGLPPPAGVHVSSGAAITDAGKATPRSSSSVDASTAAGSHHSSPLRDSTSDLSSCSTDDSVVAPTSSGSGPGMPLPLARAPSAPAAFMQACLKFTDLAPAADQQPGPHQAAGTTPQPELSRQRPSSLSDSEYPSASSGSSSSGSKPDTGLQGPHYVASSTPSALVAAAAVHEAVGTAGGEPTASSSMLPKQPQAWEQCGQPEQGAGQEQWQQGETMGQARRRLCAALLLTSALITALHMRPQWVPDVLQHAGMFYCMYWGLSATMTMAALLCQQYLDLQIAPYFKDPLSSSSLADFWGHRWNITQSLVLKGLLYDPLVEGAWLPQAVEQPAAAAGPSAAPAGKVAASRAPGATAAATADKPVVQRVPAAARGPAATAAGAQQASRKPQQPQALPRQRSRPAQQQPLKRAPAKAAAPAQQLVRQQPSSQAQQGQPQLHSKRPMQASRPPAAPNKPAGTGSSKPLAGSSTSRLAGSASRQAGSVNRQAGSVSRQAGRTCWVHPKLSELLSQVQQRGEQEGGGNGGAGDDGADGTSTHQGADGSNGWLGSAAQLWKMYAAAKLAAAMQLIHSYRSTAQLAARWRQAVARATRQPEPARQRSRHEAPGRSRPQQQVGSGWRAADAASSATSRKGSTPTKAQRSTTNRSELPSSKAPSTSSSRGAAVPAGPVTPRGSHSGQRAATNRTTSTIPTTSPTSSLPSPSRLTNTPADTSTAAGPAAPAAPAARPPCRLRRHVATMAVFVWSGLEHELFFWYATGRHSNWRWMTFFAVQGPLMMAEQLIKRAGRALGLRLPHALSSALTLALLEQCAARWFFPVLRDKEVMHRVVLSTRASCAYLLAGGWLRDLAGSQLALLRFIQAALLQPLLQAAMLLLSVRRGVTAEAAAAAAAGAGGVPAAHAAALDAEQLAAAAVGGMGRVVRLAPAAWKQWLAELAGCQCTLAQVAG